MLLSRLFSGARSNDPIRFALACSRRCLSSSSPATSSANESKDDSNEWLWSYLRDRKTFAELNDQQKRRVIEIEIQTLRESGERVPEIIPEDRYSELMSLPFLESRKVRYGYLFLRELYQKRRAATVALNDLRRAESAKRRATLLAQGKQPTNYPGYTSIFRHLGRQHEKLFRDQVLAVPARLGDVIAIDCAFEHDHAREHYLSNLVDQVQHLFADVTQYHSPSFVYLCNLARQGRLETEFHRRAPLDNMCFEATESSYLDLFPRDKLIYLSPDSNVEMTSFDHSAVYIIGGIADLTGKKPLTFGKAKRENIKHQRFPLDRYVKFGGGSGKILTIDQVYNILMTVKHTGSWVEAFKCIPDRKLVQRYQEKQEYKQRDNIQSAQRTALSPSRRP